MACIKPTIPILYRSVDWDGTIRDCNQHYIDRLGYTMDETIGSSVFDHSTSETREELRALFAKWRETYSTSVSMHVQLVTKSGEAVNVIRTLRNRYVGDDIVGVDTDMREVDAIEKLQRLYNVGARDGYEDHGVLRRSVDYMGIIVDCSQSYLDNLGYRKDEVIGISLYEHTASRSKGNLHANMENWRVGYHSKSKIWVQRKDGSEFPTILASTDETDEDGAIVGRTVTLTPVDE